MYNTICSLTNTTVLPDYSKLSRNLYQNVRTLCFPPITRIQLRKKQLIFTEPPWLLTSEEQRFVLPSNIATSEVRMVFFQKCTKTVYTVMIFVHSKT